jgi:hypothetical protein
VDLVEDALGVRVLAVHVHAVIVAQENPTAADRAFGERFGTTV